MLPGVTSGRTLEDCAGVPRSLLIVVGASLVLLIVVGVTTLGRKDDTENFGTFTDCAKIGTVVTTSDPVGDQRRTKGATVKASPQGDLLRLRVSKSRTQLCVEFQAEAPIRPYVAFVLTMRPQATETPIVQLESTVLAGQAPDAYLDTSGNGRTFRKVKATVGIRGDRLAMLVDRKPFADAGFAKLFASFRFQARSAVAAKDEGRLTDCMPVCE
jgi:hypothetical protein